MGRNSHCTEVERQLVKKLRAEGKTYRYIANTLGRSENFVTNSLKKKCEKENRGRPRLTGPAEDRRIVLMTKKDPFVSSRQIAAEMGLNISSRTIRRRLVDANLPGRKARRVPLLRKVHIQRRKAFANEHRDWCGPTGEKKWRNILFSDEVKMNLYGNDSKRSVRRPKGKEFASQYTKKTIKHGGGNIMVWGCFSWQGVGPLFWIKDTMTAVEYRDILQNVMLPYAEENLPLRWCYQQDNDPKHTSRLVSEWLRNANISCMQWPSQSPDLNPIENLWSDLKRRLADFAFQNKEQLWQKTKEIWDATPLETCQKLIKSMPNRIGKLIQNHGGYTGY